MVISKIKPIPKPTAEPTTQPNVDESISSDLSDFIRPIKVLTQLPATPTFADLFPSSNWHCE